MTALLNWRVWAAVMVAIALAASHWKVYKLGGAEIRAEQATERLEISKQTVRLMENNTLAEDELRDKANTLRRAKNAQIERLNTDLATALDGLRNRPERPGEGDLPEAAGAGPTGCTGAGLFRPDAEFLTRKATERDTIAVLLDECQAKYTNARNALK